jgi:hypothetical protein
MCNLDKKERLVKTIKSGSMFVEPLASRCLKFERESVPQVLVSLVAHSCWETKLKGRQVIPMAAGTAKHLKKAKAAADNGMHELTEMVSKKSKTIAKTSTRKKVTAAVRNKQVQVTNKKSEASRPSRSTQNLLFPLQQRC